MRIFSAAPAVVVATVARVAAALVAVAAPAAAQAPVAPAAAGRAAVEEAVVVAAAFRFRVAEGVSRAGMKVASARSLKCLGIFQRECRTRPAERLSTSTEAPINRPLQYYSIGAPVQDRT